MSAGLGCGSLRPFARIASASLLTAAGRSATLSRSRYLPLLLVPLLLSSTAGFASARRNNKKSTTTAAAATPAESLPLSLTTPYSPDFNMAWRCSGLSNRELVQNLCDARIVKTSRVRDAMLRVDRGLFAPRTEKGEIMPPVAYEDAPVYLGFGATISAPHMHAMALELLADHLAPGKVAMDVGSGSGYLVAAMAEMVAPKTKATTPSASKAAAAAGGEEVKTPEGAAAAAAGAPAASTTAATSSPATAAAPSEPVVYGIEHIDELVKMSLANLAAWDPDFSSRISVAKGDGRLGLPGKKFDAIHVGAAAAGIPPALLDQLKPGGRLVIPVGPEGGDQRLEVLDKEESGKILRRIVTGVRYVPLTSEQHQRGNE